MQRRKFLESAALGAAALLTRQAPAADTPTTKSPVAPSLRYGAWLAARHQRVSSAAHIDAFLQPPPNNQWAKFDPELGYLPSDSVQRDGADGSRTVYRYGPDGERRLINYADRRCCVNTLGNSFRQCHQVSDGETWQEYLAAYLGEPIRNFGVGGYGVFQAFARLRRIERMAVQTPYLIFNIYDDDHRRTLMPWRSFVVNSERSSEMYHGNPWTHLRVNLDSGGWEEAASPCPTTSRNSASRPPISSVSTTGTIRRPETSSSPSRSSGRWSNGSTRSRWPTKGATRSSIFRTENIWTSRRSRRAPDVSPVTSATWIPSHHSE